MTNRKRSRARKLKGLTMSDDDLLRSARMALGKAKGVVGGVSRSSEAPAEAPPMCWATLIEHEDGSVECPECDTTVLWHSISHSCGWFSRCERCHPRTGR
jgi:hypothetical protein